MPKTTNGEGIDFNLCTHTLSNVMLGLSQDKLETGHVFGMRWSMIKIANLTRTYYIPIESSNQLTSNKNRVTRSY